MAKKAHKKLRDLARLQALYGSPAVPSAEAISSSPVSQPIFSAPKAAATHDHTDHSVVLADLRGLLGMMVLMLVLLFALYWLVGNTSFADWLLSIGRRVR